MPTTLTGVNCRHLTEVLNQIELVGVAEALTLVAPRMAS